MPRHGADRAHLPGEDRPRRRHHPAATTRTTPKRRWTSWRQLVDTAGADEVARVVQSRARPDPATFVGKGKAEELREVSLEVDSDTVVFDNDLTPAQQFNLEKILGPHRHRPHRGDPRHLRPERPQPGGQGPGRAGPAPLPPAPAAGAGQGAQPAGGRHVGRRRPHRHPRARARRSSRSIAAGSSAASTSSKTSCKDISRHRDTQRKARRRSRVQQVAIVGYTNAGKSTLLNRLTDAGVLVEDRLFATLDATTRRLELPGGEPVLLTDTVGFVRKLPHQLVEAFKSTLEVVTDADLLVHIVDAVARPTRTARSTPSAGCCTRSGRRTCPSCWRSTRPTCSPDVKRLVDAHPGSVAISALTGDGIEVLLRTVGERLRALTAVVELAVPYDRGDVLAAVHREGEVVAELAERRRAARPGPARRRRPVPLRRVRGRER